MTYLRTILLLALFCSGLCSGQEQQHVIVVVGAEGTPEYGAMFAEWADQWEAGAAAGQTGLTVIGRDGGENSLQQLQQAFSETAGISTTEPLWLVLIGHGTFDGRVARFNLRGPDLSTTAAKELVANCQRPLVFINCSSCSAPFINALSGPDRTVITGTKDGGELQFCRFGGYLAAAIGDLEADIDRDGQTSLLEAWLFAVRRTEEYYQSDGRLATEHSLLDDSGDGLGIRAELFDGVRIRDSVKDKETLDGKQARRWHLIRSAAERSLTPEQRAERDRLEAELEKLRNRKPEFSEVEYLRQLEEILLPLARLYEQADGSAAVGETSVETPQ